MKIKLPILALAVLTAVSGRLPAQSYETSVTYNTDIRKTIVRTYNGIATISYVDAGTERYFSYADNTFTVVNYEIDPNLDVMDFAVFEDSVYFCGVDNTTGVPRGFVGSLFAGNRLQDNSTYNIYKQFSCLKPSVYVDSLRKMVVYREADVKHIVAVGSVTDGQSTLACTLDMHDGNVDPHWQFTVGASSSVAERLTQICLTESYVVAAGIISPEYCSESFRVHNRADIFLAGGPQDTVYFFPGNTSGLYDHAWPGFALTSTEKDRFTVASYMGYPSKNGIVAYEYDIPSFLSTVAVSPTWVYNIYYSNSIISLINIQEIRYHAGSSSLVLLMQGTFPTLGVGSVVADLKTPTAAGIDVTYVSDVSLFSIGLFTNNYVAQGHDNVSPLNSIYFSQPVGSTSGCGVTTNVPLSSPVYSSKYRPRPYLLCGDQFDYISMPQNRVEEVVINVNCSQP